MLPLHLYSFIHSLLHSALQATKLLACASVMKFISIASDKSYQLRRRKGVISVSYCKISTVCFVLRTEKLFSSLKQHKLLLHIPFLEGIDGNQIFLFKYVFQLAKGQPTCCKEDFHTLQVCLEVDDQDPAFQMKLGSERHVRVCECACLSLLCFFSGLFKRRFTEYCRKKGRVPPSLPLTS